MNKRDVAVAHFVSSDLQASDLSADEWKAAHPIQITKYWSGARAPTDRHAEARIIWTDNALLVRFEYCQVEPFVISETPVLDVKTIGLWDRDTCEAFIAVGQESSDRYYEFEASPVGEWLDLKLRLTEAVRETDWEYASGMATSTRIVNQNKVVVGMCIPWEAFARRPRMGDVWRINLCRCIGSGPDRGYLAWQPTRTAEPNFHVPDLFGDLRFDA